MEELINHLAMVKPGLQYDPFYQQGNVGRITRIDMETNDVHIEFDQNHIGWYDTYEALILLPYNELHDKLSDRLDLFVEDYHDAKKILSLTRSENEKSIKKAWDIVRENPKIMDLATITVYDYFQKQHFHSRNIDGGLSY